MIDGQEREDERAPFRCLGMRCLRSLGLSLANLGDLDPLALSLSLSLSLSASALHPLGGFIIWWVSCRCEEEHGGSCWAPRVNVQQTQIMTCIQVPA